MNVILAVSGNESVSVVEVEIEVLNTPDANPYIQVCGAGLKILREKKNQPYQT